MTTAILPSAAAPRLTVACLRELRRIVSANTVGPEIDLLPDETHEDIKRLTVSCNVDSEREEPVSHVDRSPGSSWGGREVSDGTSVGSMIDATLKGRLRVPGVRDPKASLQAEIDEIPEIISDLLAGARSDVSCGGDDCEFLPPAIVVEKADPVEEGVVEVEISYSQEATAFKSPSRVREEREESRMEI